MFQQPTGARCLLLVFAGFAAMSGSVFAQGALPRTVDGKPNLQGIWQARTRAAYDIEDHTASHGVPAGRGVVEGGKIPYQPAAAAKRLENFKNRKTADPLSKCYMPGVPRIMYMEYPFHIFQTPEHVAITFEYSQIFRLIYTNGKKQPHEGFEFWMGDSRGRWEGDTLVVDVKDQNDKTWFDLAGNFHSAEVRLTERYKLVDADTIQYDVEVQDPKVFTRAWKMSVPLVRQKGADRVLEYMCQAEAEEASGDFEREPRAWYPAPGSPMQPMAAMGQGGTLSPVKTGANLERTQDGKPNITGYFSAQGGGANYGLEKRERDNLLPGTRGVVIDPPDGMLPYQPWAREEYVNRNEPWRGYDDSTAHCFVAGVPRGFYTPSPFMILQPPGYIVILFERMAWRAIPLDGRAHIPDGIRLWQGDSVGRWEGDTLVVDTANLNGKAWLNEAGDVMSHAAKIVERFIPTDNGKITYRATVTDPIAFTKPWTIEIPANRNANEELLEVACHEDNGDLQHLKDVRDEYRAKQKKEK